MGNVRIQLVKLPAKSPLNFPLLHILERAPLKVKSRSVCINILARSMGAVKLRPDMAPHPPASTYYASGISIGGTSKADTSETDPLMEDDS